MLSSIHKFLKEFKIGFIELCLALLMIIGLIGYFWIVPGDLEWLDHTISFTAFTILFYRLSITSILFGKRYKRVDAIIVISYFLLFFKDILIYTDEIADKLVILGFIKPAYYFLLHNKSLIDFLPSFIAFIGIIFTALYSTYKINIVKPSMINAIVPVEFLNTGMIARIKKFTIIFVLLISFYYFVYNLVLEWLEFTFDDPIVFVGIIYFFHKLHLHRERFHKDNFILKIGDFSETLYRRFIALFHYRKTLYIGISGLLVLHILSDLGIYLVSYTTWLNNIYIAYLGEGHTKIITLLAKDISLNMPVFIKVGIFLIYLFNIIAIFALLLLPVFLWYNLFKQREFRINRVLMALILTSFFIYALYPTFAIKSIASNKLVGVDIITFSFLGKFHFPELVFTPNNAMIAIIIFSIILFIGIVYLTRKVEYLNNLLGIMIIISMMFVGYYTTRFFQSQARYFIETIIFFFSTYQIFFALMFITILLITFFFYLFGYFTLVYEVGHEFHNNKWSKVIDRDLKMIMKKIEDYEEGKILEKIFEKGKE